MGRVKKFLLFVFAQTLAMGLFTWVGAASKSLMDKRVADLFSAAPEIMLWGAAVSMPFIFVGAFLCIILAESLQPKYYLASCVGVGFFCLFPFVFTKGIESVIYLIPGSLGLIAWFFLAKLIRVNNKTGEVAG
jgi:hypothetical protein